MSFCKDLLSIFFQTIYTILFYNCRTGITPITTAHINQVIKPTNVCVMDVPADNTIIVLFLLIAVYNQIVLILINIFLTANTILKRIYQREPKEPF